MIKYLIEEELFLPRRKQRITYIFKNRSVSTVFVRKTFNV